MEKIRERIYLASLLHDIGVFYQKADNGTVLNSYYLKGKCKEESSFCPFSAGEYKHKHILWTAQFIEDNSIVFKHLLQEDLDNSLLDKDGLLFLAAGHHLAPDRLSTLGNIIKEADFLSSGIDFP